MAHDHLDKNFYLTVLVQIYRDWSCGFFSWHVESVETCILRILLWGLRYTQTLLTQAAHFMHSTNKKLNTKKKVCGWSILLHLSKQQRNKGKCQLCRHWRFELILSRVKTYHVFLKTILFKKIFYFLWEDWITECLYVQYCIILSWFKIVHLSTQSYISGRFFF